MNGAASHLARTDRILARYIKRVGPCPLAPHPRRTPFQALVRSVIFQQLNGAAAETIFKRLIALFPGRPFPTPEDLLATPESKLRGAGLSRHKLAAIRDIATKTLDGTVPTRRGIARLSDAEIIERLTTIRGVGPWTVEMLLIFTLGRPDVLPVTDFGVRKGYALAFGCRELPSPEALRVYGQRWQPHRSAAAWYLWRVVDLHNDLRP